MSINKERAAAVIKTIICFVLLALSYVVGQISVHVDTDNVNANIEWQDEKITQQAVLIDMLTTQTGSMADLITMLEEYIVVLELRGEVLIAGCKK